MRKLLSRCLISVMIIMLVMAHVPANTIRADDEVSGEPTVTETVNEEGSETAGTDDVAPEENKEETAVETEDLLTVQEEEEEVPEAPEAVEEEPAEEKTAEPAEVNADAVPEKSVEAEVKKAEETVKYEAEKGETKKDPSEYTGIRVGAEVSAKSYSDGAYYNGEEHTWGGLDSVTIKYYVYDEEVDGVMQKRYVSEEYLTDTLGYTITPFASHQWNYEGDPDSFYETQTEIGKYFFNIGVRIEGNVPGYYVPGQSWNDDPMYFANVHYEIRKATVDIYIKGLDAGSVPYDGELHVIPMDYEISRIEDPSNSYTEDMIIKPAPEDLKMRTAVDAGIYYTAFDSKTDLNKFFGNSDTDHYDVNFYHEKETGTFEIRQALLTVTTGSSRKMFDENDPEFELTNPEISVEGLAPRDAEEVKYSAEGRQVGCGTSTNVYKMDWGKVNPNNYKVIEYLGTLTIYDPREVQIIVTLPYGEAYYDGQEHTLAVEEFDIQKDNPNYPIEAFIYTEDEMPSVSGINAGEYIMDLKAGSFKNTVSYFKETIIIVPGKLNIKPIEVTLASDSATKVYDGEALTAGGKVVVHDPVNGDITTQIAYNELTEFDLVNNEKAEMVIVGSQTEIGSSRNNFKWGTNANAKNYVFKEEVGTLTVADSEVNVTLECLQDFDKTPYNGSEQTFEGYFLISIDNEAYDASDISYIGSEALELVEYKGGYAAYKVILGGVNADDYVATIKAEDFVNNNEDFDVTFAVTEKRDTITFRITPLYVGISVAANRESHTYTGETYTMSTYNITKISQPDNGPEYNIKKLVYTGESRLTASAMGVYREEITAEKFVNNDGNYYVDVKVEDPYARLEILQVGVAVKLKGNEFFSTYTGAAQELKIDQNGHLWLNGDDKGLAFTIEQVYGKDEAPGFDESLITLRKEYTVSSKKNAGTYSFTEWMDYLTYPDNLYHVSYEIEDYVVWTINPAPVTIHIDDVTAEYTDTYELTASFDGILADDGRETYSLRIEYDGMEKYLPLGHYPIKVSTTGISSNYEITNIEEAEGTLHIVPKNATVTITGPKVVVPYDGEEHFLSTYEATCDANGYFIRNTYTGPEKEVFQAKGTEPDVYMQNLNASQFTNNRPQYNVTFVTEPGELKIVSTDELVTLEPVVLTGGEYVYDGQGHPAYEGDVTNITLKGSDGKNYTVEGAFIEYVSGNDKMTNAPVNAGTYTASVKYDKLTVYDEDGYNVTAICTTTASEDATITITPRLITVHVTAEKICRLRSWNEQVSISYTIEVDNNVEGDGAFTKKDIVYNGNCTASTPGNNVSPMGSYNTSTQLDISRFSENSNNYDATFVMEGDGLIVLELIYSYYSGQRLMLKLNATAAVMEYNGQEQVFVPEIIGLDENYQMVVSPESNTSQYYNNGELTDQTYTITVDPDLLQAYAAKGTNVKEYHATNLSKAVVSVIGNTTGYEYIGASVIYFDNYTIPEGMAGAGTKLDSGVLKITPKTLSVTINPNLTKVYGDIDPDRSTWIQSVEGLPAGTDYLSFLTVGRVSGEDVGTYDIFVKMPSSSSDDCDDPIKKGSGCEYDEVIKEEAKKAKAGGEEEAAHEISGPNYTLLITNPDEAHLTITPAVITIIPNDDSKRYGTNDPVLTATVSGLIGSEYLPEQYYSVYRDKGEDVGDYDIHVAIDIQEDQEPGDDPILPDPGDPEICEDCAVLPPIEECNDCEIICKNCGLDDERKEIIVKEAVEIETAEKAYEAKSLRYAKAEAAEALVEERVKDSYPAESLKEEYEDVKEKEYDDDVACEIIEDCPGYGGGNGGAVAILDPTIVSDGGGSGVFKFKNYTFDTSALGNFNIWDKTDEGGEDPVIPPNTPNDPTPDDPTPNDPIVTPRTPTDPTPDPDPIVEVIDPDPAPKTDGPVDITVDPTPTTQPDGRAWALVNLLATIGSVLTGLGMVLTMKKKKEEEKEEQLEKSEEDKNSKRKTSKLLGLVPAITSVIAFVLTEDIRLPMVLTDKWTLLMMAILVVNLVLAYFTRNREKKGEDDKPELQGA